MSPKEKPRERRSYELENECADVLADRGYLVHQNPTRVAVAEARRNTGDTGNPEKAPDYLVEGHVFDCYAPEAETSVRGVWTAVVRKVREEQTQRVAVHLADWRGRLVDLQRQFDDWPVVDLKEVVAVKRDGSIVQILRTD
ncbi:hypothetical protein [Polymorphospora sp. NPDC050346]|uniref:CdiA C-terminal domain-containing protein n=1 Tax=Polymorphospora sp. NPDC050346 TaxID=3155780 RepID=UPI0033CBCEB5